MVRVKNRYFLVEIRYADQRRMQRRLTSEEVYKSVRQAVKDCYGDYGLGALKDSLMVKYLNPDTNMVIIRAKRDLYHLAHAAFTFVRKVAQHDCFLHTLHTGGTIRTCQKFLIQHHRQHLPLLWRQCRMQGDRDRAERALLQTCVNMEQTGPAQSKNPSLSQMS